MAAWYISAGGILDISGWRISKRSITSAMVHPPGALYF
jgi:hypothetical protein